MSSDLLFDSQCLDDTWRLGLAIGRGLAPGDVVGLVGPLGAGKTALTRAIAAGLAVPAEVAVNSPTFTVVNLYQGAELALCHLDLYRLADSSELAAIGIDDLVAHRTALVVEWFDLFPEAFDADRLVVAIEPLGEDSRRFRLAAGGPAAADLLRTIREELSV